MVPIRCIISTGVGEDTIVAEPPLVLASVMEAMVMLTAANLSDGLSPIFTSIEVAFGCGLGFGEDAVPPPQPDRSNSGKTIRANAMNLSTCGCDFPSGVFIVPTHRNGFVQNYVA